MSETGWSPTHRARTAHPAGHSVQCVKRVRISPRAGRGMPGQFCDHNAVSVTTRQGTGVSMRPAVPPAANLKRSLRVVFITPLFVAVQATVFGAVLAMARDAVVHLHAAPDIARIAADAVLFINAQPVRLAVIAMASRAREMG